jgi:hypothetical protein
VNWLTDRARKFAIGVPFKNGYTSILKVLNGQQAPVRIQPNHMKNFRHKIFVVRHPLDRFLSLWRNKCRDHGSGVGVEGFTMEQLWQRIQNGQPDGHWISQMEHLGKYRDQVELVRLEDLPAWWYENMQAEFPHENQTAPYDAIGDELREQVLAHYADDVELYNAAAH